MLFLNLRRVFALRGIKNPYTKLVELGISRPTAWNLLDNKVDSIKNKHLKSICEYLNCEPNDLYEWRPPENVPNLENHPLNALRRDNSVPNYEKMIRELPLGKIDQVKELLTDLKDRE